MTALKQIIKRDGTRVAYDRNRIVTAIFKATTSTGSQDYDEVERLAAIVEQRLIQMYSGESPTVEDIQDLVEMVLVEEGRVNISRAYISYRTRRAERRKSRADLA